LSGELDGGHIKTDRWNSSVFKPDCLPVCVCYQKYSRDLFPAILLNRNQTRGGLFRRQTHIYSQMYFHDLIQKNTFYILRSQNIKRVTVLQVR